MGKKIWEILKRILLGVAAWFAALTVLAILEITLYPGRQTYPNWYVAVIFFLPLGVGLKVALRGLQIQIKRKSPKPQPAPAPIPVPPKQEPPKNEPPKPVPHATSGELIFPVAGVSFREKSIIALAEESEEYQYTKKEIIDECFTGYKIWRYHWRKRPVELVPEPDNQYDPNAVKVVVDGAHIGYIKRESCKRVLQLLAEDRIRHISCTIGGGPYKAVWEEYDDEKDRDTYRLERDEFPIWAKVKITEKKG